MPYAVCAATLGASSYLRNLPATAPAAAVAAMLQQQHVSCVCLNKPCKGLHGARCALGIIANVSQYAGARHKGLRVQLSSPAASVTKRACIVTPSVVFRSVAWPLVVTSRWATCGRCGQGNAIVHSICWAWAQNAWWLVCTHASWHTRTCGEPSAMPHTVHSCTYTHTPQ